MRLHAYIVATSTLLATAAFGQATAPVQYLSIKPNAMLTSKVVGLDVYNQKNEKIGEIADVVIEHGALEGYVLSIGGFLGMGERYVAVQPSSVSIKFYEADNKWRASANATKDQLKSAPEFKYHSKWKG